jgi:hypothetical protein
MIWSQRRLSDLDHLLEQRDGLRDLPVGPVRTSEVVLLGQPAWVSLY